MSDYFSTAIEAKDAGHGFYFTGNPCKNGHIAPRYVSSRDCVKCLRKKSLDPIKKENNRLWKEENKKLQDKYCREYNRRVRQSETGRYYEVHKKNEVQKQLRREVAAGRIIKPNKCSNCNAEGYVEGHHWDYDRPLDVVWLCRQCHAALHAQEKNDLIAVAPQRGGEHE